MENGRLKKAQENTSFLKNRLWRVGGKVVSGCRGEGSVPRSPKRIVCKRRVSAKVWILGRCGGFILKLLFHAAGPNLEIWP